MKGHVGVDSKERIIHSAEVTDAPDADHVELTIRTGKGVYVRSLARDLAVPPDSLQNVGPWYGIDTVIKPAASSASLLTRNVVDLAKQTGKLDELEAHTLAAMKSLLRMVSVSARAMRA